jgi:hypothetical protein
MVPDGVVMIDPARGVEDDVFPNDGAGIDNGSGANDGTLADPGARGHHGTRVDSEDERLSFGLQLTEQPGPRAVVANRQNQRIIAGAVAIRDGAENRKPLKRSSPECRPVIHVADGADSQSGFVLAEQDVGNHLPVSARTNDKDSSHCLIIESG